MRCAMFGCGVDNQVKGFSPDIKFFSFPKDEKMRGIWRNACERGDYFNIKNARMCSKHFSDSDYERNLRHELLGYRPKTYRPLKKEAIPSRNLPYKPATENSNSGRTERFQKRKDIVKTILKGVNVCDGDVSDPLGDGPCDNSSSNVSSVDACTRDIGVNTETDTEVDDRDKLIASLQEKIKYLEQRQGIIEKL